MRLDSGVQSPKSCCDNRDLRLALASSKGSFAINFNILLPLENQVNFFGLGRKKRKSENLKI